jgi:hypothetical protein
MVVTSRCRSFNMASVEGVVSWFDPQDLSGAAEALLYIVWTPEACYSRPVTLALNILMRALC